MVETIFSPSSQNSLKFLLTFGIVHHVLLHHLDFYLDHATLFSTQVLGGIHENFISTSYCAVYIYVRASFFGWLVSTFDWFKSFCLIEFIMDLHLYNIVCHDTTPHDTTLLDIIDTNDLSKLLHALKLVEIKQRNVVVKPQNCDVNVAN